MKCLNLVGPQVRRLRYNRGWSQNQLATKLQLEGWDISRSGVAKIESQLVYVDDFHLYYLQRALKVTLTDLLPKIDTNQQIHLTLLQLLTRRRPGEPPTTPFGRKHGSGGQSPRSK